MKETVITLVVFFIIMFVSMAPYMFEESDINPFDYARITDVEYKAVVVDEPNNSGKVVVTERLTFDIHAAYEDNPFWELWRDLPEDYVDGLKVDYKVNSVKQILDDGTELVYKESPKLYWDDYDYVAPHYGPNKWFHSKGPYNEYRRQYECLMLYINGIYRDELVFEIEYEMNNAALRYADCSELYLCMYSEDTVNHLESFKGEILIPLADMPRKGNYDAYTFGTNSHDFEFTESTTLNPGYHTFSFDLDKSDLKFRPYNEYIEFDLVAHGADKHIFTEYAPSNHYTYDDVLQELRDEQKEYEGLVLEYACKKIIILIICSGVAVLIVKSAHNKDGQMRAEHTFYKPSLEAYYFRDIPSELDPNFASELVFCKHRSHKEDKESKDGYSAVILSLVRKGYIELDKIDPYKDWTFNNVKIVIKRQIKTFRPPQFQAIQEEINRLDILTDVPDSFLDEMKKVNEIDNVVEETVEENPLTKTEELYFNLISKYAYGVEISMSRLQSRVSNDYENTESFVTNIKNAIINIGVSQGYFQKSNYDAPKIALQKKANSQMIWGILIIILANLISYQTRIDFAFGAFFILGGACIYNSIYLKKLSKQFVLLTQFGEDEYVKWRGLYNFLNSETLMKERTVIELPLWEQYLVYATAFGISEKVISALKIRCPDIDMSPMLRNPYYRSHSFYSSGRSFRTTTRRAYRTSRSSFYGGGYGGGSWRIRRRRSWWRRRWRWPLNK
ncbi:MAG: DUF2207 domain-containing protein [Clostridia bacterium]|nr:DUF2207 domain-containing protein [Clostridia bacterium]